MKKTPLAVAAALLLAAACCHQPTQPQNTANAAMDNILSRKSVRSFTADSVAPEVIDQLLRAAMAAPSGMDIRPWSFVVLTDKSRYDTIFAGNHNLRMFKESAAVIVVCADTTVTRPPRNNPDGPAVTMPNPMWRDDMGAATQNLLLAAEAHHLGACWTACYPFADRMQTVRQALQLPPAVVPYCVVPVGVPNGQNQPKDKWDPARIKRM